jgi:hypothetical protein
MEERLRQLEGGGQSEPQVLRDVSRTKS